MELPSNLADIIINAFKSQQNDTDAIKKNLENLLVEAKTEREMIKSKKDTESGIKRGRKPKPDKLNINSNNAPMKSQDNTKLLEENKDKRRLSDDEETENLDEGTDHIKAQHLLINIGKVTGCSIWVASNDCNRKYQGELLGKNCIITLPNFGLDKEAMDRIAYIDVIWIQQNAPICAFEVGTTTSIYSGILRMSDLFALVPALKIKLFIVAPRARAKKVIKELNRPTFREIGLNEFCRFIAIEDLEKKYEQIQDLYGDVRPSVIEKIALDAEKYKIK